MEPNQRIKDFCYRQLFPRAGLVLIKLISRTYRYRIVGLDHEWQALRDHGSVVYASWHQRIFPGFAFFAAGRQPISVMISQSRDGEMIARAVSMLGWQPVRGSSSRGGLRALKQLHSLVKRGYRIMHIVDGPQGPFGIVKPGLLTIAQFSGAPILPAIGSFQRCWIFSSWDRFMVPKPFSKILVRFAPPITVPRRLEADALEALRLKVENQIKDLHVQTDKWWRDPKIIADIFD